MTETDMDYVLSFPLDDAQKKQLQDEVVDETHAIFPIISFMCLSKFSIYLPSSKIQYETG